MNEDTKLLNLHNEIKQLILQKDKFTKYIDDFEKKYLSQLKPLKNDILIYKYNSAKKKFKSIEECYISLEEDFKNRRKTYISLSRIKENILKELKNANLSQYKTLFEKLTENETKVQYMKEELLDLKQLIKNINLKSYKIEFEKLQKEYLIFSNENMQKSVKENRKDELKQLYKKASKLCHPDMVSKVKFKEAQKTFQELNSAYMKEDYEKVENIYTHLKVHNPFVQSIIVGDIIELTKQKKKLISDIRDIKEHHFYSYAFNIENITTYFVKEKKILQNQLEALKNINIDDEDYIISKLFRWADFHKLDYQTFPRSIKKLKDLEFLNLRNKKIIYLLSEINFLKNLKKINLSVNTVAKLPDSIGELKNLEYLDLSHNQLEKIPLTMLHLKKLHYLDLSSNIFQMIPLTIGELTSLKTINFSSNEITNFSKGMFKLKNLEELYFNKNRLKLLPKGIKYFKKLELLEFGGNYIRNISKELYELKNLKTISLFGNHLKFIPSTISKLQNLQELNLGSNLLEILPNDIVDLQSLKNININMNHNLKLTKEQQEWKKSINNHII